MVNVVTPNVSWFRVICVYDPGCTGNAGSCSAAANSGTFGSESAVAFTERYALVWSSKIHATLVVFVIHDQDFVAVTVAPMLLERLFVCDSSSEPLLTPPSELMNPSGVRFLYAWFDSS